MTPQELFDGLAQFDLGMNSGVAPVLLPKNQAAFLANATVRGTFARPRPPWFDYSLDFGGDTDAQNTVLNGLWQGGTYYLSDASIGSLVVAISGRLFQVIPDPANFSATVTEVTGGNSQDPTAPQHWLWQAEKWVIWNDGVNLPVFFDGTTTRRSVGNQASGGFPDVVQCNTAAPFSVSAPPGTVYNVTLTCNYVGNINDGITIAGGTTNAVQGIVIGIAGPVITVRNVGVIFGTVFVPANSTAVSTPVGTPPGTELPPGKMGAYGLGRNWVSLPDGRSFIASDIVGSSSGTAAEDYRDAVLHVTENTFLLGGGVFRIPLSGGEIRAIIFQSLPDTSLGQGPLLVFTPTTVFSCQAPVDRLIWSTVTNPILTETLIGTGGLGQNSTKNANGDVLFRSLLGFGSVILGRRDFDVWGNVPISREVERVIDLDAENLLPYGTAANFDNRMLMSCSPQSSTRGVYHKGVIAINFDPLSNMQGKKPSCYDGLWPGLNAFQMMTGEFDLVSRCYAFCFDEPSKTIKLTELLPSKTTEIYDNGNRPIQLTIEGPVNFYEPNPAQRRFKKLDNGELMIDDLQGEVTIQVFYKPDDWPCWIPWHNFRVCNDMPSSDPNAKPAYKPRLGLGTPSPTPCDEYTNRPFREAYYFQVRIVITGHCRFRGGKFTCVTLPEPKYATPEACCTST